jgi:alkylation response protein AidB-like acyl-CoA dehydrogenase
VVEALRDAGLFGLCVPKAYGGGEAHPRVLAAVVEAVARGDGAAGWCVAVQATTGVLAGRLEPAAAKAVFGDPRSIAGGVFAPRGRAVAEAGGALRATGRWPFASGCDHADWLCAGCLLEDGDLSLLLVPRAEIRIHDTWHVSGLRGTGSHDMELDGVRVPADRAVAIFTGRPVEPGRLYAFPLFGLLAVALGAVALGIARGALDDLVAMASGKTPTGSRRTLAERATVQAETARCEAALRAASAFLGAAIDDAWESDGGRDIPVERRLGLRLAATHAAEAGAQVAGAAFRLGGGSAIYESSPLQRRFRDAQVVPQHMLVAPATWELAGRLLLDLPTDVTQL